MESAEGEHLPSSRPWNRALAAAAVSVWLALGALPAQAHTVFPLIPIVLRPGGEDVITVADQATCAAAITVTTGDASLVRVYAIDMQTGEILDGDGLTATVTAVYQAFLVEATDNEFAGTTAVRVCWTGVDFPNPPCNENNCPAGVLVTVEKRTDPQPLGANPFSGIAKDPVDTRTGGLSEGPIPIFSLGGPMGLAWSIQYDSRFVTEPAFQNTMGPNWRHSLDWRLTTTGFNKEILCPDGRVIRFEKPFLATAWSLAVYEDVPFQLVESGLFFRLADPRSNWIYTFLGSSGVLTKIEDGKGNSLTLTYSSGRVSQIVDGLGRALSFTYSLGRLSSASDGTRSVAFTYDGSSRLATMTNPMSGVTTFAYDPSLPSAARLLSITRPRGNVRYTQTYSSGRVATQTDAYANTNTFSYNLGTLETTVTDPLGNSQIDTHDADARLTERRDEAGLSITLGYDAQGRRTALNDRIGGTLTSSYHAPSGKPASLTQPDGATTCSTYTSSAASGLTFYDVQSITHPNGATESFTYDGVGNLLTYTTPTGGVWTFTYNARGQVLTATNPLGGVTTYTYNADGTVATIQNPISQTTTLAYDALRRPNGITHPDGTSRMFVYDNLDRLTSRTNELSRVTTLGYDANSNLTSITTPLGAAWTLVYDDMDRVVSTIDPLGQPTSRTFDPLERVATVTNAMGNTLQLVYDSRGRLVSVVDPAGNTWPSTYNNEAVLASSSNPLSDTFLYQTDPLGRVTGATTPLGGSWSFARNPIGAMTQVIDPAGRVATIDRNAWGDVTQVSIPAAGITSNLTRNALRDVVSTVDPRGNSWSRSYDAAGRIVAQADPLGNTWSFTYDNRERLASMTLPGGLGSVSYLYDAASNLTRILGSDGADLRYTYDNDGRLVSAVEMSIGHTSSFTYNARGDMTSTNGVTMTHDNAGRVTSMTLAPGKTVTYAYDARGLVIGMTDWLGGTHTFAYDAAGRLVSVDRPNGVDATRTYDDNGRIASFTEGAFGVSYVRNANGQVTQETRNLPLATAPVAQSVVNTYDAANRTIGVTHDAAGRVIDDGVWTYQWDVLGRLVSIGGSGVAKLGATTFAYDACGSFLRLTERGADIYGVWDYSTNPPCLVAERNDLGADIAYYLWSRAPSEPPVMRIDSQTGDPLYYLTNPEEDQVIALTNTGGQLTDEFAYLPGGLSQFAGVTEQPFAHNADHLMTLGATGLYVNASVYDPSTRRSLAPKPPASGDWVGSNGYTESTDMGSARGEAGNSYDPSAYLSGGVGQFAVPTDQPARGDGDDAPVLSHMGSSVAQAGEGTGAGGDGHAESPPQRVCRLVSEPLSLREAPPRRLQSYGRYNQQFNAGVKGDMSWPRALGDVAGAVAFSGVGLLFGPVPVLPTTPDGTFGFWPDTEAANGLVETIQALADIESQSGGQRQTKSSIQAHILMRKYFRLIGFSRGPRGFRLGMWPHG